VDEPIVERAASEHETSRQYLAAAPPGPRANNLASACALQIKETALAHPSRFGELATVAALTPTTEIVRSVMAQDRDLSAWIVRKSAVLMDSVFQIGMAGNVGEKLDASLAAVGLEFNEGVSVREEAPELSSVDRDGATGLGTSALGLLAVVTSPASAWQPDERRFYENLFTGANGEDVEELAYTITAWVSVVLGRLLNTNRVKAGLPFFDPIYRDVPSMPRSGWFPNPAKQGDVSSGDAEFQRYWDGGQWTSRVRIRQGQNWSEHQLSLHDPPSD